MTDDSSKQRRQLEIRVERWTTEAKRLAEAGQAAAALELYRRAADLLPDEASLQQRTAELARKLNANDDAINYFRRAASAFVATNFAKRAVGPLRLAWVLAIEGLPGNANNLFDVTIELMQLHRRLGFAGEAAETFERSNVALRKSGLSEIDAHVLEEMQRQPLPPRNSVPPGLQSPSTVPQSHSSVPQAYSPGPPSVPSRSPAPPSVPSRSPAPQQLDEPPPSSVGPPASNVQPRGSAAPPDSQPLSARGRALARLLGRR